jgi:hypothetical protein
MIQRFRELSGNNAGTGFSLGIALLWAFAAGCGSDGGSPSDDRTKSDAGDGTDPGDGDGDSVDENVISACAESTSLIQTTDWVDCLAGKELTGKDPFSSEPCTLRVGADGAMDYLVGGTAVIAVPGRSGWGPSAYGTYQNNSGNGSRFFLASIAPDVKAEEGEPRVTHVDIGLFALESKDDTVAIRYLDGALANKTYNCIVDVL